MAAHPIRQIVGIVAAVLGAQVFTRIGSGESEVRVEPLLVRLFTLVGFVGFRRRDVG